MVAVAGAVVVAIAVAGVVVVVVVVQCSPVQCSVVWLKLKVLLLCKLSWWKFPSETMDIFQLRVGRPSNFLEHLHISFSACFRHFILRNNFMLLGWFPRHWVLSCRACFQPSVPTHHRFLQLHWSKAIFFYCLSNPYKCSAREQSKTQSVFFRPTPSWLPPGRSTRSMALQKH